MFEYQRDPEGILRFVSSKPSGKGVTDVFSHRYSLYSPLASGQFPKNDRNKIGIIIQKSHRNGK